MECIQKIHEIVERMSCIVIDVDLLSYLFDFHFMLHARLHVFTYFLSFEIYPIEDLTENTVETQINIVCNRPHT